MSDELSFEGASAGSTTTAIETAEMARDAAALGVIADLARGWERHLADVLRFEELPAPQWIGGSSGASAFQAWSGAQTVSGGAERSGAALLEAAARYGELEAGLAAILTNGGALLAWAGGAAGSVLASPATLAVLLGGLGLAAGGLVVAATTGVIDVDALVAALQEHPELIVNPSFVTLLGALVASVDDGAMGALGLPLPLAMVLGDQGAGVSGTDSAAAGVVVLGSLLAALGLPLFQRSDLALRPPTNSSAAPPSSIAEAAARIPRSEEGLPQIRIEEYVHADSTSSWIVYATGTVEWSPLPGSEPSDLSSNVGEVGGLGSEMRSAILGAMAEAGIQPGEEVMTAGHSQAGMVLAQIARESNLRIVAELSFGAPTQQIPVPSGTQALAFEHADDLVPVLGGVAVDPAQSVGRTVVSRTAFDGREVPDGEFFAAHQMTEYAATAALADTSGHPAVGAFLTRLDDITGGEPAAVSQWRADRVWPSDSSAEGAGDAAGVAAAETTSAASRPPGAR